MKSKHFFILSFCALVLMPIQAQELKNYPLDTVKGQEVYRYQVERGIGLYRIGVNFEVSQNEIIRLNPHLRERGLRCGETILVPTKRPIGAKPVKDNKSLIVESDAVVIDTKVTETVVVPEITIAKQEPVVKQEPVKPEPVKPASVVTPEPVAKQEPVTKPEPIKEEPAPVVVVSAEPSIAETSVPVKADVIELAVMLPFESQQSKRSGNADRMMEFYQGVLFGLKDLQNDSLHFRVRVFDTERSERRVEKLTDSTELDHVQAIIGLAYPIQIERMATWCDAHGVPLFLPFSNETDVRETPQVLQFNASAEQQADSLCNWMSKRDARFIAIEVRDAELAESSRILRKQMKFHKIPYSALALRDLMSDSASYALDKSKENVLIMHSDKYQQVRIVLPHIEKLRRAGYNIRIVSQYSWQKEPIIVPQVFTSMFTANTDHEAYDVRWNAYIPGEHVSTKPRYDILGYDMIHAVVAWLRGEKQYKGLEADIQWVQAGNGGWQNANVKVIER